MWKQLVYFGVNSKHSVDYSSPNSRGEWQMFLKLEAPTIFVMIRKVINQEYIVTFTKE